MSSSARSANAELQSVKRRSLRVVASTSACIRSTLYVISLIGGTVTDPSHEWLTESDVALLVDLDSKYSPPVSTVNVCVCLFILKNGEGGCDHSKAALTEKLQ